MMNTTAQEVFDSFESSFEDKVVLPEALELLWLKKAVARYSVELDTLNFDNEALEFDCKLDQYVIDTLAAFIKQFYQERQWSKVNKQISIVGKDILKIQSAFQPMMTNLSINLLSYHYAQMVMRKLLSSLQSKHLYDDGRFLKWL